MARDVLAELSHDTDASPVVVRLLLSTKETAAALGISRGKLAEMVRRGTAPASIPIGRRKLFPIAVLNRWIEEQLRAQMEEVAS